MDREQFDAITRLLATTGSRRQAAGALLGVALFGQPAEAILAAGKGKRRGKGRDGGRGKT